MSLAVALYNHHGIVMSADHLVTATVDGKEFLSSHTEQKLFIVDERYGLSCTGTYSINGTPVSALMENYLLKYPVGNSRPNEWLIKIAAFFQKMLSENQNIVFILCGYYENQKFMISNSAKNPENIIERDSPGTLCSGESEFASHIVNFKLAPYEFSKFTMKDSVNFLKFLNRTVSDIMYFGQYAQSVSRECDILAISPTETRWVERFDLN